MTVDSPRPVLPPGHDRRSFMAGIAEFRKAIGEDNVFVEEERLAPYTKIMIPGEDADHAPSAAIAPASVPEIQAILAICNRHRIPVWPVSTGKNFGYGTAAPAMRGTVVLDLRRLNRIIEVDGELGTALVEPGVTYRALLDHLKAQDLPYWIDVPAPGPIVGPVGQILERGIGYTPYGDHFAHACGMEVVLANGDILRTGMGSIAGAKSWQTNRYGYGPYLDGIFSQSNFGVVTKMGLGLMPRPEVYKPFLVSFPNHGDLPRAVEIARDLSLRGVIRNTPVVGHVLYMIAMKARRADVFPGEGSVTDEWITQFTRDHHLGIWVMQAALYGSAAQVAADWALVEQAYAKSGAMLLTDRELGDEPTWQHAKRLMAGELDLDEFGLYNWRGGGGSAWFAPVARATGADATAIITLGKQILAEFGFDYLGGFMVQQRNMIAVMDLLFDRSSPDERKRAHDCFARLMSEFGKRGYGIYRTNIAFMDAAAALQGPVRMNVNRTLKRALDPNGIIAPGKSGIHL